MRSIVHIAKNGIIYITSSVVKTEFSIYTLKKRFALMKIKEKKRKDLLFR